MKQLFVAISICIGILPTFSQPNHEIRPLSIKSYENITDGILLKCDQGEIVVSFFSSNVVRLTYYPFHQITTFTNDFIKASATIVNPKIIEVKNIIKIKSSDIEILINKTNGSIDYADDKGNSFLTETEITLTPIFERNVYDAHLVFTAPDDENYYGLGQLRGEWLNHRGLKVNLANPGENQNINGIPFLVTNKHYGVLLVNTSNETVAPGIDNKTEWYVKTESEISYFVIHSNTIDGILGGYHGIIGTVPIPSRTTLGYIQGRHFKSQTEVIKIAKKYREKKYSCDNLLMEMENQKVAGDMDWDPKLWPHIQKMNSELAEDYFKTLVTCSINFKKESKNFALADKNNFFVKQENGTNYFSKHGGYLDLTNNKAIQWYCNLLNENYAKKGFYGWRLNESNTGMQLPNEHSPLFTKEMFEEHRNTLSTRSLLLSEKISPGTQIYGTIFSSFHDDPDWDIFKQQITMGINISVSGFPFWGSNIGGYNPIKDDKPRNQAISKLLVGCDTCMSSTKRMKDYIELYVRWFQFGTFCPIFISDGMREQNELWSYGADAEKILAKYVKLRYRLLPYIYSLAFQAHQNGTPLMRGLFMDFPSDAKAASISDEYMFGPSFLISPVTEQGKESREIYLPIGSWFDYWTNKRVKGGETSGYSAPIDKMPIFIKAGSIIPFGPEIQYATEKLNDPLEIRVYPGADSKFDLYEDENDNYHYETGKYALIPFTWNEKKQTLTIGDRKGEFDGMEQERTFTILFGGDFTKASETIAYKGKSISIKMD